MQAHKGNRARPPWARYSGGFGMRCGPCGWGEVVSGWFRGPPPGPPLQKRGGGGGGGGTPTGQCKLAMGSSQAGGDDHGPAAWIAAGPRRRRG